MASRQQRRQGVVYGPVRPGGPERTPGEIFGRALGLIVVVLAIVVLVVAGIAFLNDRGAGQPTQPATLVALSTPSPGVEPSPSEIESILPTADATLPPPVATLPPATLEPTPVPTPTPPLIQLGPGFVTFGTQRDSELRILDPDTSFSVGQRMFWSAHLIQPANSSQLRVRIIKADPAAAGGQRVIREDSVRPPDTQAQIFLRRVQPANILEGPGLYTVQYLRDEDILAEGSFLIEE